MKNKRLVIELIKYFFVMAVLLLITVLFMEVPGYYFDRSDERLFEQVNDVDYTVNVANEEMNMSQKIDALRDENSIITELNMKFSDDDITNFTNMLTYEIQNMLDYGWEENITDAICSPGIEKRWGALKIVKVIDNDIYSYELGVMLYNNSSTLSRNSDDFEMFAPGIILFDMNSGKILYMNIFLSSAIYNVGYYDAIEYGEDINVMDYADNNDTQIISDTGSEAQSYFDALADYYNMQIDIEHSDLFVSEYGLWASPFTVEEVGNSNFDTIYNYIYTKIEDWY